MSTTAVTSNNNNENINKINIPNIIENDTDINHPIIKHTHKLSSKDLISNNTHNKHPSSWEPIDDLLLRHLKEIKKMGWKEISQYFENRTPNACQFRWRRLKSGNLKSNKTALMDVTIFPGEIKILNPYPTFNEKKQRNKAKDNNNDDDNKFKNKGKDKNTTNYNISKDDSSNTITLPNPYNPISAPQIVSSSSGSKMTKLASLKLFSDNNSVSRSASLTTNSTSDSNLNKSNISISKLINTNDQHESITTSSIDNRKMIGDLSSDNNKANNNTAQTMTQNNTLQNNFSSSPLPISSEQPVTISNNTKNITSTDDSNNNNSNNSTSNNSRDGTVKKFIKPRSYSHSVTSNSANPRISINSPQFANSDDTERFGFIPKVFVKSRRGSSIIIPSSPTSSSSSFLLGSFSSVNTALNTTLTTYKSRKNSFVRRHSLVTPTSALSSRRSSIVIAPNSLSINFNNYQLPTAKHRRESAISRSHKTISPNNNNNTSMNITKNWEVPMTTNHLFNHNYSFTDIPVNSEKVVRKKHFIPWSMQEDQLLLENQSRKLSISELSILLPNRSESDIDARLHSLAERLNNNINAESSETNTAITTSASSSDSSKFPTPQPELPDFASPIHSPSHSYILNQTDPTINAQEFKDHLELDSQRSGTAQSHTYSSKEVSPSTFSQISLDDSASSSSSVTHSNIVISDYPAFLKSTGQEHSALVYQNFLCYQQHILQERQQQQSQTTLPSINAILQRY